MNTKSMNNLMNTITTKRNLYNSVNVIFIKYNKVGSTLKNYYSPKTM